MTTLEVPPIVKIAARGVRDYHVAGEPTPAPGLFITAAFHGDRLTGEWLLIHAPSGCYLPLGGYNSCDLDTVRRIAACIASLGLDWTVDGETIEGYLKDPDTAARVRQAIKDGKFPPVDPGTAAAPGPTGQDRWPATEYQATAKNMAITFAVSAQAAYRRSQAYADTLPPVKERTEEQMTVWMRAIEHMGAEYAVVALLRAFSTADVEAADAAAREVWSAFDAGDSFGEWLWAWLTEYGIDPDTIKA